MSQARWQAAFSSRLIVTAMQIMGFSVGAQNIAKGALIIVVLLLGAGSKETGGK
ncbi:MAG: hypothetical protein ACLVJO_09405 [[Clostridium] scindens]